MVDIARLNQLERSKIQGVELECCMQISCWDLTNLEIWRLDIRRLDCRTDGRGERLPDG